MVIKSKTIFVDAGVTFVMCLLSVFKLFLLYMAIALLFSMYFHDTKQKFKALKFCSIIVLISSDH